MVPAQPSFPCTKISIGKIIYYQNKSGIPKLSLAGRAPSKAKQRDGAYHWQAPGIVKFLWSSK
jgi:hypothetical protein